MISSARMFIMASLACLFPSSCHALLQLQPLQPSTLPSSSSRSSLLSIRLPRCRHRSAMTMLMNQRYDYTNNPPLSSMQQPPSSTAAASISSSTTSPKVTTITNAACNRRASLFTNRSGSGRSSIDGSTRLRTSLSSSIGSLGEGDVGTGGRNDDDGEGEEQHLNGIGVGIDLGTTNSAVAMMIPVDGGDGQRTRPAMIEVDDEGRTIPSVVAFLSASEDDGQDSSSSSGGNNHSPSLPPWTLPYSSTSQSDNHNLQWPTSSDARRYRIHIGKRAIRYEQDHPRSTYRNVKRIIGTGGKMAELATGVVPNLFIPSVHGNNHDGLSGDLDAFAELDAAFDMLERGENKRKGKKKHNKKKKKKATNKWKKKKERELPKLQKQLEQASTDPALLSCTIANTIADNNKKEEEEEVQLRPEQISACILRKLYDTAEQQHYRYQNNGGRGGGDGETAAAKVTRAVIGVPAYFTEAQRQATIRASEIAGVDKVKLLPEPEAAALAYGAATTTDSANKGGDGGGDGYSDKEELILVFDLGGGTFDVSILEVGGGVTEVLATVGNNRLGGTDFDKRVAEYLSGCAVEFGRKLLNTMEGEKKNTSMEELGNGHDDATEKTRKTHMPIIKDWYREGEGEIPDIILRAAEEARKCLSNQKIVEVLVPLTEVGWRRVGSGDGDSSTSCATIDLGSIIGPFDKSKLASDHGMVEGDDYTIASIDRKMFESICYNELQMLLQPIREVAIMAGVLLPGEARPIFVENAKAMAKERDNGEYDDVENFWEFENEEADDMDDNEELLVIKTGKDGLVTADTDSSQPEETLHEQALLQIQAMDVKAQKKAQQRGRKKARDIANRERSFRKQKQSAMEEATTASLLGTQLNGGKGKQRRGVNSSSLQPPSATTSVSVGNERVQEGIHGRPLSRIVLVGGATRMPVIAKLLEAVAGMVPQRTVHPDEAVALGCAVQVGILDGENEGLLGGMQAVLSPMQAAVMRALAKKRGMDLAAMESGAAYADGEGVGVESSMEMMMSMGGGGISGMMVVDEFDDEDDFY